MIGDDDLDDMVEATERILAAAGDVRPKRVSITYVWATGSYDDNEKLVPKIDVEWYS